MKIEEIHQYVPFEDKQEEVVSNIYWEALKLKQKLAGSCREKSNNNNCRKKLIVKYNN
jgi:hypothetical protein